jgi:hypothetical protein
MLMQAQYLAGEYEAALDSLRRIEGDLTPGSRMMSVAVLEANGDHEGALSVVKSIREEDPRACVGSMGAMLDHYRDAAQRETVARALLDAGLPADRSP